MTVSSADAAHLLRRSGFGVAQAKVDELTKLSSRYAAVDRVLDLSQVPPATPPIGFGATADQYGAWRSLTGWWLERMRTTPVPIVEKMTLFWHGHFVTALSKVTDMGLLCQQHQVLRQHAMGDFGAMTQAVSIDPAMLLYLDNALNFVWKAQENFGRELMELFTLGTGQYSQADVVAMARAWTGHSVDDTWRTYRNRSEWHDNGSKQLFAVSARNWDGPAALTEVLKGSKADASARFITAKVFSYLAYPVLPTDSVVGPIAASFRAANLNIGVLVRQIFRSNAFWSAKARRALVRTPVEWMVATLQATNLTAAEAIPQSYLDRCGQTLFNAPDVSGWKQNEYWLSTSQSWGRSSWALLVRYLTWKAGLFKGIESSSASAAVSQVFTRFGITEPSPTTRAALEAWFTKAKSDGDTWSIPLNLTHLVMLSPDFQVA